MKTPAPRSLFAFVAPLLALTIAAWAQDPSPTAPANPPASAPTAAATPTPAAAPSPGPSAAAPAATPAPSAPDVTPAPSAAKPDTPPAAAPAPTAPTTAAPAAAAAPASATPASDAKPAAAPSELRRLDEPAPTTTTETATATEHESAAQAKDTPAAAPAAAAPERHHHRGHARNNGNAHVAFWHNSHLAADEHTDAVVSIFGSSSAEGDVDQAVISVCGSSTSSGEVGQAVVSVLGSTTITGGSVGQAAVSVLGNTKVNGHVGEAVVSVLGNIELGPDAVVDGDLVCVGGTIHRDPHARVNGDVNNIELGFNFGGFEWLHAWVAQCLVKGRPLGFGPHLMWAWWLALAALGLYVIFALLFPRPLTKCAETLEQRPGYSILTAFLVTLLTPAAAIILLITIVGTPALIVCLVVGLLFGKAAMLLWIGRRFRGLLGEGQHPVVLVLIGGVIVLLLYTVPFVGFVVSKLLSWLGLGVVTYTALQAMKRKPAPAATTAAASAAASVSAASIPTVPPVAPTIPATIPTIPAFVPAIAAAAPSASAAPSTPPPLVPPPVAPIAVSAATLPRAGFWVRLGAALLDALIVGVGLHFLPHSLRPGFMLVYAAYCAIFWALRATTVGGIVCGLKLVRIDERPVDWMTAVVRALAGFLSLFAVGLGFLWVLFDDQRQSWHDKIAGTTIVRVPRGVPLV